MLRCCDPVMLFCHFAVQGYIWSPGGREKAVLRVAATAWQLFWGEVYGMCCSYSLRQTSSEGANHIAPCYFVTLGLSRPSPPGQPRLRLPALGHLSFCASCPAHLHLVAASKWPQHHAHTLPPHGYDSCPNNELPSYTTVGSSKIRAGT